MDRAASSGSNARWLRVDFIRQYKFFFSTGPHGHSRDPVPWNPQDMVAKLARLVARLEMGGDELGVTQALPPPTASILFPLGQRQRRMPATFLTWGDVRAPRICLHRRGMATITGQLT